MLTSYGSCRLGDWMDTGNECTISIYPKTKQATLSSQKLEVSTVDILQSSQQSKATTQTPTPWHTGPVQISKSRVMHISHPHFHLPVPSSQLNSREQCRPDWQPGRILSDEKPTPAREQHHPYAQCYLVSCFSHHSCSYSARTAR
jgi:hypothetical protein